MNVKEVQAVLVYKCVLNGQVLDIAMDKDFIYKTASEDILPTS